MIKRTTIEIDQELLERAKGALGPPTPRGTVEEALRRAAGNAEGEGTRTAANQRRYLEQLASRIDLSGLASEQTWR